MRQHLAKVGIGLLLPVIMLASAVLWVDMVFPHSRPKRALEDIFDSPNAVQVVRSRQSGFFFPKNSYYATATVRGEGLNMQSYLKPEHKRDIRELSQTFNACEEFLKEYPRSELFYGTLQKSTYSTDATYVAYDRPSQSYCFIYHRF